jgi:hypothetical protein
VSRCTEPTSLDRAWAYGTLFGRVLLVGGAFASIFIGLPGAIVMLAGLTLSLVTHLGVGVIGYRRVMTREWPKVRPLDDEDDW